MFKSYWIVATTLGIAVLTTEAWAQSVSEGAPPQEESAADPNQIGENQNGEPIDLAASLEGIEAAIRALIAEEDKIAAEAQQSRESRDLEAQEGMAKWAEWMFYATAATVALTLVALFAIIRTLHHPRRAADYTGDMLLEAENATKAAEAAVDATRDIGEKQVRAYLHIKGFAFSAVGKRVVSVLTVANAGQSPAIAAKVAVTIDGGPEEAIVLKLSLPNIASQSEVQRTLTSRTDVVSALAQSDEASTSGGILGATRITAIIVVDAQDVFGNNIGATSLRTIYVADGVASGDTHEPEDAEGFFPDAAVRQMARKFQSESDD